MFVKDKLNKLKGAGGGVEEFILGRGWGWGQVSDTVSHDPKGHSGNICQGFVCPSIGVSILVKEVQSFWRWIFALPGW